MATFDQFGTNQTNTRAPGIAQRIAATAASIRDQIARRALYRRTVNELSAMSNRELADIGVNRSMIHSVAHQAVNTQR
ncbi:DUF1127 domain-containing protein [Paracoccus sp. Z118]|uniref:DUF1127 domain-containing protein n=1 Tax=Paracoccus sp. Z118 TaxID=2851017 RepID=UPI001C2C7351|nr:DUF1127 domain-containing protein [Paracoccus sp. Z118]MBV0890705.1 DUF1127 domain-containing protein [Paracoccus sp. Z118]